MAQGQGSKPVATVYKTKTSNASGITGIVFAKVNRKWRVRINFEGKNIEGGYHDTLKDAVEKRVELEQEYYGEALTEVGKKTQAMKWMERYNKRMEKKVIK